MFTYHMSLCKIVLDKAAPPTFSTCVCVCVHVLTTQGIINCRLDTGLQWLVAR